MASFCRDCSIFIFGKDFGDFKHNSIGRLSSELCEGCGEWILVDWAGRRWDKNYQDWIKEITL
jgi:hypothetical protein